MKKIICIILVICIFASICIPVGAEEAVFSIRISEHLYNIVNESLTITGEINHSKTNIPVLMVVKDEDGNVIYTDSTRSDKTTNKFVFDKFLFIEDVMSEGVYLFEVFAENTSLSDSFEFEYASNGAWYNFLKTVNENRKTSNYIKNSEDILNNLAYTGIKPDDYSVLSEEAKILISKTTLKYEYVIPSEWQTIPSVDDIDALSEAIKKFQSACQEGMIYAELSDVYDKNNANKSKASFDLWMSKYKNVLKLEEDNPKTTNINEKDFFENEFKNNYNKTSFYKKIPKIAAKINKDDIQTEFVYAAILSMVKEASNGTIIRPMIKKYSDVIGLSEALLGNSTEEGVALGKIAGREFESIRELAKEINSELRNTSNEHKSSGVAGGNGGGGGVYGGNRSVGENNALNGVVNESKEIVNTDSAPFDDLDDFEWARDAVDFLYKRSIVNGKDERSFDPSGKVTRAEFVKMISITYGMNSEINENCNFKDVSESDWFYKYLKSLPIGIINGDEYGRFNPDANLTREDMAVIVFRASHLQATSEKIEFVDADDISSYAKEAIASLYEKGIISGVGNMRFAAKNHMLRAEAAQILYNVLKKTMPAEV